MSAVAIVAAALANGLLPVTVSNSGLPNQLRLPVDPSLESLIYVPLALELLVGVASVVSLVLRYRRAGDVERHQLRWLAAAGSVFALASPTNFPDTTAKWSQLVVILGMALIPMAIGVAILRYRLYEIDTIINRALVYGSLTAVLGGGFVAAQNLIQRFVVDTLGVSSDVVTVGLVFTVAATFTPLRAQLQSAVARRFKPVAATAEPADPVADALRRLTRLRDERLISDAEFEEKKREVLARLQPSPNQTPERGAAPRHGVIALAVRLNENHQAGPLDFRFENRWVALAEAGRLARSHCAVDDRPGNPIHHRREGGGTQLCPQWRSLRHEERKDRDEAGGGDEMLERPRDDPDESVKGRQKRDPVEHRAEQADDRSADDAGDHAHDGEGNQEHDRIDGLDRQRQVRRDEGGERPAQQAGQVEIQDEREEAVERDDEALAKAAPRAKEEQQEEEAVGGVQAHPGNETTSASQRAIAPSSSPAASSSCPPAARTGTRTRYRGSSPTSTRSISRGHRRDRRPRASSVSAHRPQPDRSRSRTCGTTRLWR